jgi:hypothetical protein
MNWQHSREAADLPKDHLKHRGGAIKTIPAKKPEIAKPSAHDTLPVLAPDLLDTPAYPVCHILPVINCSITLYPCPFISSGIIFPEVIQVPELAAS